MGFSMTNVLGTQVLLQAAKDANVSRFLFFSTDAVYGETPSKAAIDCVETTSLNPKNPYAGSKAAAEMLVHAYTSSFNLPIQVIRSNNVYGPHQYPESRLISYLCILNPGGLMDRGEKTWEV